MNTINSKQNNTVSLAIKWAKENCKTVLKESTRRASGCIMEVQGYVHTLGGKVLLWQRQIWMMGGLIKSKRNVERHASASLCRVMDCSGCQLLFSEKRQPAEGHACVKLLLRSPNDDSFNMRPSLQGDKYLLTPYLHKSVFLTLKKPNHWHLLARSSGSVQSVRITTVTKHNKHCSQTWFTSSASGGRREIRQDCDPTKTKVIQCGGGEEYLYFKFAVVQKENKCGHAPLSSVMDYVKGVQWT